MDSLNEAEVINAKEAVKKFRKLVKSIDDCEIGISKLIIKENVSRGVATYKIEVKKIEKT